MIVNLNIEYNVSNRYIDLSIAANKFCKNRENIPIEDENRLQTLVTSIATKEMFCERFKNECMDQCKHIKDMFEKNKDEKGNMSKVRLNDEILTLTSSFESLYIHARTALDIVSNVIHSILFKEKYRLKKISLRKSFSDLLKVMSNNEENYEEDIFKKIISMAEWFKSFKNNRDTFAHYSSGHFSVDDNSKEIIYVGTSSNMLDSRNSIFIEKEVNNIMYNLSDLLDVLEMELVKTP